MDTVEELTQVYLIYEFLLSNLLLEKLLPGRQRPSFGEATMLAFKEAIFQEKMQETIPHVQDNSSFRTRYSQRSSSLYGPGLLNIHPEVP